MVAPLKGNAELANAGIPHHCRDLEHTLGRSGEELRSLGHTLLQEVLMDWDPIDLTEAGLQSCTRDPKPLGQHLNCQPLIQVP